MKGIGEALARKEWARRHIVSPSLRAAMDGRVSGVVAAIAEWVGQTPGASCETLHETCTVDRGVPRTLHDEVHPAFTRKRHHVHPEVFRAVIPNARVVGLDSVVLTEDRRALVQSTFGGGQFSRNPVLRRRLRKPSRLRGRFGLLAGPWYFNHYHWMLEVLTRAKLLGLPGNDQIPVIVPKYLSAAQIESLEMIGITRDRMVPFDHTHVVVDELVFPSFVGTSGSPPSWAVHWLRDQLSPPVISHGRRIYVSRALAQGPVRRRVVNEDAVMELLEPLGFERIQPELYPFSEQLRCFAESEIVVAPHGSGLANLVAAREAAVVELHAKDPVRPAYYVLAGALGLDYWYQLCEPHPKEDLFVDLELLQRTIEAAIMPRTD